MTLTPELKKTLEEEHYLDVREIPGRGICGIHQYIYTFGLLYGLSESGYKGRYCYPSYMEARLAIEIWTGEGHPPLGWIKHKAQGIDELNPNK
jgi:hypothetical protein